MANAFDEMSGTGNAFDAMQDESAGQLRLTARKVAGVDPDKRAESLRLGSEMGLPFDVVERNLQEVQKKREDNAFDALVTDPALASWITADQNNAALAKDDVPTLTKIAQGIQRVTDYGAAPVRGLNQGIGSGIAGLGDLIDAGAYGLARLSGTAQDAEAYMREAGESSVNPATWLRSLGEFYKKGGLVGAGSRIAQDMSPFETVRNMRTPFEAVPDADRNLAIDIGEGLGNMAGQAAATIVNPTTGLALLLGQGADQQAQMVREAGAEGTGEAYAAIAASAPIAAALEKLGLDRVLKVAPPGVKNSIARYVLDKLAAAGVEAGSEAAEQLTYNELATLYNPDQSLTEGVADNFTVGGAVGGIARILVGARYARTRAEREGEVLDALSNDAAASRLRERDPARFRQLIEGLGDRKVFLNAEQAQAYFQSANVDPATVGINAEELADAVALGGDIAVPMADWLTAVAPDHGKALGKFARMTPAGMDRADLETFDEEVDGAAVRFLESVYEAERGQGAVRDVFNDVLGQQLANGVSQGEAETQAAVVQRLFNYLGGNGDAVWDLYQQYGLRIVKDQPELLNSLARRPNIDATLDSLIERLRTGDYPKDDRVSLADFLAEGGGLNDPNMAGEVATLGESDRVTRRGKRRLVNPETGRDLDRAREAAAEAGYLPMDTNVNDLLALLEGEMAGNPTFLREQESTQASDTRQAMDDLAEELGRLGIDVSLASNEDIKRALFDGGMLDQSGMPRDTEVTARTKGGEFRLTDTEAPAGTDFSEFGQVRRVQAFDGDKVIGTLIYANDGTPPTIEVDPEYRRRGVGTAMLKLARQQGGMLGEAEGGIRGRGGEYRTPDGQAFRRGSDEASVTLNQSAVDQTQTPEFKRWFGDSKVVDENGEPLVAYHATDADFDTFIAQKNSDIGFHFGSKDAAGARADALRDGIGRQWNKRGEKTLAVYLSIKNPLRVSDYSVFSISDQNAEEDNLVWELRDAGVKAVPGMSNREAITAIENAGYDGLVYENIWEGGGDSWVAFRPEQIKSATANRGTFDPNDPSILNQSADEIERVYRGLNIAAGVTLRGNYYSTSRDFAREFTRSGRDSEVVSRKIKTSDVFEPDELPFAGDEAAIDAAIEQAKSEGKKAVRVSEGVGQPPSLFVFDKSAFGSVFSQSNRAAEAIRRGYLKFGADRQFTIGLTENADRSTFFHEAGHFFLEVMSDIAASSDAPAAIRDDWSAISKWWSDNADHVISTMPAADRASLTPELIRTVAGDFRGDHGPATKLARTALHEYTARGWERYLAEGKAPTPETVGIFARLRAWMLEVYKTLSALNVNLSDDVRGVFDRMIAGDRAIRRAEDAASMEPLFKEAATLGWSEARFREYLRLRQAGHEEAEARLASRALKEVQREREAWWREESAAVQREVESELYAMPVYQAWANLAKGTLPAGSPLPAGVQPVKLDKNWLVQRYGQEFLNKNLLRKNVYAVEGGVNPDLFAATYGFRDGDELVTALSNALPLAKAAKAETLSRMRDRHGDMRTDPNVQVEAMRAIHNSRTMKAIEVEVAALEELTGTQKMSPKAVREWARRKIAGVRVRDLTPMQYLRAERKFARQAIVSAGKGDMTTALQASRRRLANAILYAESSDAQDKFDRRQKWIKAQAKKSTQKRLGEAGQRYRDAVNNILASLGARQPTAGEVERRAPLRSFVDDLQAAGDEVSVGESVIARVDSNQSVAMRDMTVTDFTEAYEAIKSLKHVAGQQNKLLASETRKTRDEAITEMAARAAESLPERLPESPSERGQSTVRLVNERLGRMLGEMDRPENVIEALDGGETGPWHDYFWSSLSRAEESATDYRGKLAKQLKALRKSMPAKFMDSLADEVELPFGARWTRGDLLGIVLNTGNATNLQRLRDGGIHWQGRPVTLTDDQVQAMRDLLTPDEARYVQGLWDAVNSLWPDIVKLQTEMTGIPPEKVQPQSFAVNGQPMRGGYWPLAYDHSKSEVGERQSDDDAMRLMMGQGYSRATTPKGYTKSRVENVKAALQLDFGTVMSRHLDNVMTDLAYRKAVKDITSLMRDPRVKDAINGRLGKTAFDTLKGAVAYSVSPSDLSAQAAAGWRQFQGKIISNAAVSALAIRPDIALGNYASALVQGLDRTGVRALARGWWEFNTRRTATTEKIAALSPFMAQRLGDIDHHYGQEIGKVQGKSGFGPAYKRVMMTLHRLADHDVTRAVWWGRYRDELDKGATQAEAVRLADATIRQTQTASGRKDLSTLERDPAFRESRMFMGPMFVIMGRMRAAAKGQGATQSVGSRAASLMLQVFLAPTIFMLAAGRWPEDDDDDDRIGAGEWAWWLAKNTALFPLQALPYAREAASALEAVLSDKPISPRAAPTAQAAAGMVKASKAIYQNIEDYQDTGEMDWLDMTRDIAVGAGPLTGVPSSQIRLTSKVIEAAQDDPDRDAVELARMAIYGPPKE